MVSRQNNSQAGRLSVELDDAREVVRIEGIDYSYEFFRGLARGLERLEIGAVVRIVERKDHAIVFERVEQPKT